MKNFSKLLKSLDGKIMKIYDYEDLLLGKEKVDCTGKLFCFSGKFRKYKMDLEKMVSQQLGGVVKSGVSKKLNYLVVPDYNPFKSQKQIDAEQYISTGLQIKILKESEFMTMVQSQ